MSRSTPRALVTALALAGIAPAVMAASNEELEQQVKALQQAVAELQTQLKAQKPAPTATAKAAKPPVATAVVNPPAEPAPVGVPEEYATRDDINGLQADLENFKYQVQRDRDTKTALSTRSLNVSGVVQAKFTTSDQGTTVPAGPGAAGQGSAVNNRHSTFDLGAVQLAFTGSLYKDYDEGRNLDYTLRFGTSPQQGTNNSFLNLLDANLTYNFLPTISPDTARAGLTLGQQLLPYGQEVQATEDLKPTINNAQYTLPGNMDLARRQVGLILRGDVSPTVDYGYNYRAPLLSYAFGAVNGNGPNKPDDNSAKDWLGRLAFTLPSDYNSWLRQLTLGASIYKGTQNLFVGANNSLVGTGRKDRYGLDLAYNHHPIGITYEYNVGRDATASGTAQNYSIGERRSVAHTATLFYNIGEQFVKGYRAQGRFDDWWPKSYQPFYRFDRYDPNVNVAHDRSDIHTLGLNVFFAETTKFQLNWNHTIDQLNNRTTNDLLAQFQFGF